MLNTKLPLFPNMNEDDEDNFLSCEEEGDDDEFFEFESSQALDNPHNEPSSTIPHVRISEVLNNNPVKKSLMQKLFNLFRGLIEYLKNIWLSNPSKQGEPATDIGFSIGNIDNSDQALNASENAIIATNTRLNNSSFLAPPNSHSNAFYQKAKKEHSYPIQASRYGLN